MKRILILSYGVLAYALFHATFLYLIAFVAGLDSFVPRTVDAGGPDGSVAAALAVNGLLILLFGIQHAVMARPAFKRRLARWLPESMERSTFMIATCAVLALLYWQWRPLPDVIWSVEGTVWFWVLAAAAAAGWGIALVSTFLIDHFELFGLRQAYAGYLGVPFVPPRFSTRGFYTVVRHPLMLGLLIAFWSAPHMTLGHLVFAVGMTSYVLVGVTLEEKDLLDAHPGDYARYREETGMILPSLRRSRGASSARAS